MGLREVYGRYTLEVHMRFLEVHIGGTYEVIGM